MSDKRLFTKAQAADYVGREQSGFDDLVRAGLIRKGHHPRADKPTEPGRPTWKREWLDEYVDKYVLDD